MNEPGLETRSGPRGFYYDRLRVPNGDYSPNPLSPSGKESLRADLVHREGKCSSKSGDRFALYMGKSLNSTAAVDATMGRTAPVDTKTRLLTDTRAQDLSAEAGFRRSMQTNIVDFGPHVNTNMLRFHKHQGYMNTLPLDGGWRYSPNVCTGNFVEERREPGYASGFHARELGLSKIYQTEHSARYKPPSDEYYKRVISENPIAKFPPSGPPKVIKGNDSDGHNLYYSNRGFGDSSHMDHTVPPNRGGYWVGTAPVKKHDTIAMTAAKQEPLEFQQRCSVYDPTAKFLANTKPLDVSSPYTQKAMKGLAESQRFTATWSTSYSTDYKDMSRRAHTAEPGGKLTGRQLGSVRPITAAAGPV